MPIAVNVPLGIATDGFFRSPEIFDPARIPVVAGKKIVKTEKKFSPAENFGYKFSRSNSTLALKWPIYD